MKKDHLLFRIFEIALFTGALILAAAFQLNAQCEVLQNSSSGIFQSSTVRSQTFVATCTGPINTLSYVLTAVPTPTTTTVTIRDGGCSGSVIGSTEVHTPVVGINTVTFSTPPNVVNGQNYAFRLADGAITHIDFGTGNPYPDGQLMIFSSCNAGSTPSFDLRFSINDPFALPVELIHFSGKEEENGVALKWQTASEVNNEGFEIQHSLDGKNWEELDFVEGFGTTFELHSYSYTDENPTPGINYYRLKQYDYDGGSEFSKTVSVEFKSAENDLGLFPNPASSGDYLSVKLYHQTSGLFSIYNVTGQKISEFYLDEAEETFRFQLPGLQPGIYNVRLQSGRKLTTKRLVVR